MVKVASSRSASSWLWTRPDSAWLDGLVLSGSTVIFNFDQQ
jgi:hypothetical protein